MRKLIASMNLTLDGFCDHTAGIADDDLHENANALLAGADAIIFGRITYQLMESHWPAIVQEPTGNKSTDDFAVLIDNIEKVVFSRTLQTSDWKNTRIFSSNLEQVVRELKNSTGRNIAVGSPSLIIQLMQLNLIDEYQFCIHPVVQGGGLPLFKEINNRIVLDRIKTQNFASGAVNITYVPTKK